MSRVSGMCFCAFALAAVVSARPALAVDYGNFSENGATVNGYQDDFAGGALGAGWLEFDGGNDDANPLFTVNGGLLQTKAANGDPNKLLYNPAGGDNATTQNVPALGRGPTPRTHHRLPGGGATGANTTDGRGINLLFRAPNQNGPGNHFNLLNDAVAWGPNTDPGTGGDTWAVGQWKWLRVVTDGTTVRAKIWDAGAAAEPAAFDLTWTQQGRTGLAGLATDSVGGLGTFDVDYVLIQAAGLPSIQVVPEPASAALPAMVGIALLVRRRR